MEDNKNKSSKEETSSSLPFAENSGCSNTESQQSKNHGDLSKVDFIDLVDDLQKENHHMKSRFVGSQGKPIEKNDSRSLNYRDLFDNSMRGIAVYNYNKQTDDFTFVEMNEAGRKICRLKDDEFAGRSITEVFPSIREFDIWSYMRNVNETGVSECHPMSYYEDSNVQSWFEYEIYRLDGGEVVVMFNDIATRVNSENELMYSKTQIADIMDQSPFPMLVTDAQGYALRANKAFQEMLGLFHGDTSFSRYNLLREPAIEAAGCLQEIGKVVSQGDTFHGQFLFEVANNPRKNQDEPKTKTLEVIVFPILDDNGNVFNIVAQYNDISRPVEAEAGLRFQAMLLDQIHDAIIATDLDGKVTYANRVARDMLQCRENELIGMDVNELQNRNDRKGTRNEVYRQVLRDGQWMGRMVSRTSEGTSAVLDSRVSIIKDQLEKPVGMVGIYSDISNRIKAEEAFRQSEKKFSIAFSNSPDAIAISTMEDAVLVDANEAYFTLNGYTREEMIGQRMELNRIWCNPEDRNVAVEHIKQCGTMENFEVCLVRKDGKKYWGLMSGSSINLHDQSCVLWNVRDISPLKEIQREKEEVEREREFLFERLQQTLELMPIGCLLIDTDFRFTYWNAAAQRIFGYSLRETAGFQPYDLIVPEISRSEIDSFLKWILGGETRSMEMVVNRRKDGSQVLCEWHCAPLRNSTGDIIGIIAMCQDITERHRQQVELRKGERWLATTLNSVADAVITTDTEGCITFINRMACQVSGFSIQEARGKELVEIYRVFDELTGNRLQSPVEAVLERGKSHPGSSNAILVAADGARKHIIDSGRPIIDDRGEVLGVVLVFQDISQQREIEAKLRQKQKMESIGTLASGVAHEINNPIHVILNDAELILMDVDPEGEIGESARDIITESKRIAEIVRNLLWFSRKEYRRTEKISVKAIIEDSLMLTKKLIMRDQIEITTSLDEELPEIECHQQQIQQVVMNILSNAKDALNVRYPEWAEEKAINVSATTILHNEKQYVRISIRDCGSGIASNLLGSLFDPFFTTKGREQGTGLGLSISYGIVKAHGGEISVDSKEGEFTEFHVDLPVTAG